jgi:dTDP-4-dehydrorhamnose 3,5-epimerase
VRFTQTSLQGAFLLEPEKNRDGRGFFARMWDARELAERGLCSRWVQSSISFNKTSGTLRGLHLQEAPFSEVKLVTCVAGGAYDVIVDLRPDSPSFRTSFAFELTAENSVVLYVPAGLAHGFLTLQDDTVMQYHMSEYYQPGLARGVRWDDLAFSIEWPGTPSVISERDAAFPDFDTTS